GWAKSSISVLTDSIRLTQEPSATGGAARWVILPSRPTTRLTLSNSFTSRSFISITSFKVSAIFPATPVQSFGKRTEKLPFFNERRVFSSNLVSSVFNVSSVFLAFPFAGRRAVCAGIVHLRNGVTFLAKSKRPTGCGLQQSGASTVRRNR